MVRAIRLRWALAVAATGIAALAAAAIALSGGDKAQQVALPSPTQLERLRTIAAAEAANNGDPKPSGGTVVATTRKAINALNGVTEINEDLPVYVVTLHGNFVDRNASGPPGSKPPSGHNLTLVYRADNLMLVDFMLGDYPIDASQVGVVEPLAPPTRESPTRASCRSRARPPPSGSRPTGCTR